MLRVGAAMSANASGMSAVSGNPPGVHTMQILRFIVALLLGEKFLQCHACMA
jgi:hypothetical protein